MGRSPCCEKGHINKGAWSKEEDERLLTVRDAGALSQKPLVFSVAVRVAVSGGSTTYAPTSNVEISPNKKINSS
ncbi:putative transcription regulator Homeodomain-LIKE family [Medicago truncatula]|uniref:MYB domain protein, putative n=1 Tax=Medicago truncatula TaxID=3880 RepID=A0A072V420_MEDTR|nr:MYB domain protein, putative [Medicago truncatula]RHN71375.1 putative transcription regulator Homeodomain-LIKE family [Medicago truncatula]